MTDTERKQQVLRFLHLTRFDDNVEGTIAAICGQYQNGLSSVLDGKSEAVASAVGNVEAYLKQRVDAFRDKVVGIYLGVFTDEQMAAVVSFYESDVGKVLVAKGGDIGRQINDASDAWSQEAIQTTRKDVLGALGFDSDDPLG